MKDIIKLNITPYILRRYFRLEVPMVDTTTYGLHSLQYTRATIWNDISDCIKMIDNLAKFKSIIRKHIRHVSKLNNFILHCKHQL